MIFSLFRPVRVGRLFGIPILVMPAVIVLTLLLLGSFSGAGQTLQVLLLFLVLAGSLMAHELAHALVARRLGLRVLDITIWPLGGMARMEGLSQKPRAEGPVALAGPAINLFLGLGFLLLPGPAAHSAAAINFILGLGNLVPAFPLDGGRILRAWLARTSPLVDATRAAITTANWLCFAALVAGWIWGSFLPAILLAGYVWFVGRMEIVQILLRTGQGPRLPVRTVYARAFTRQGQNSPEVPEQTSQDLEDFHGSMSEFFRHKPPQD